GISDHLSHALRGVAGPVCPRRYAPDTAEIEIRTLGIGRVAGPGELSLGNPTRREFPFRLGWQSPARPPAISVCFIPVHVDESYIRAKRHGLVEYPRHPSLPISHPVERTLGPRALAPCPTLRRPQIRSAIPAVVDELFEIAFRDGRPGHRKRTHFDRMLPFLIVENEALACACAEQKFAPLEFSIAPQRRITLNLRAATRRSCESERLARVRQRFAMHVLVHDCEPAEIMVGIGDRPGLESVYHPVKH